MNSLFFFREKVGLGVGHLGETTAERLPQMAGSVGLERRHQLGNNRFLELLLVHREVHKTDVRDHGAKPVARLAVIGRENKPTNFGGAIVRVANLEHRMLEVFADRGGVFLFVKNVEIHVGRARPAQLGDDHRCADDDALLPVNKAENVLAEAGILDLAGEAPVGLIHDLGDHGRIVRQVDRVEVPRNLQKLGLVTR
jgi:hypothetical protein